jgi:REP element-mobilizing transposase RayT
VADDFCDVFLHMVWATWDRQPLLTPEVCAVAYTQILNAARDVRCPAVVIGGIEDHVHLVVRFPTTIAIGDLAKQIKGTSSRAVNRDCPEAAGRFRWQGTYGVFAVERASLDRVIQYVQRQREHHRTGETDERFETMRVRQPPSASQTFVHTPSDP